MGWRGFIYFYEKQRIATIVILFLIFAALVVNAVVVHRGQSEVVLAYNDSVIEAFEEFHRELMVKDSMMRQDARSQSFIRDGAYLSNQSSQGRSPSQTGSEFNRQYKSYSSSKLSLGETILLSCTDTTEWKKIPGIGSSYAARIVKYQDLLGGFVTKEQLREVYGLDDEMFARISPFIEEYADYQPLYVNKAEFRDLLRHPYLSYEQVQSIFSLRKKKGGVDSLNELQLLEEFTSEDIERLRPYLDFG